MRLLALFIIGVFCLAVSLPDGAQAQGLHVTQVLVKKADASRIATPRAPSISRSASPTRTPMIALAPGRGE